MVKSFRVIEVAPDTFESVEEIGSKTKFWFRHSQLGQCLYKETRQNTGEDWAEKIASELCKLLSLPHAEYELAISNGSRGIISPSFLPENGSLILGNEILAPIVPDYPKNKIFKVSQHTINNIFTALTQTFVNPPVNWIPPSGITTAAETFVGYLLFDAWIGNTDRHHENWAFISLDKKTYLAPTYDHASCLGRELLDKKRILKLNNKSVTGYAEKCASAIYANVENTNPLRTFDAFCEAQQRYPNAARRWLNNLAKVSNNDTLELFECIPCDRISEPAIELAQKILEFNQSRLLQL